MSDNNAERDETETLAGLMSHYNWGVGPLPAHVQQLVTERDRYRAALLGMFQWQRGLPDLMPPALSEQVRDALGDDTLRAMIEGEET